MKKWLYGLGAAVVAATLLACGSGGDKQEVNAPPPATAGAQTSGAASATPAKPAALKPADFKFVVKVVSKECIPSYGCNVVWRVQTVNVQKSLLDKDKKYEVSWKLGGSKELTEGTVTVNGDGTWEEEFIPEHISVTADKNKKLTLTATAVEVR